MPNTLTFLRGLQASGKTTWALQQVKADPERTFRVNKDDIRSMTRGGEWSKETERHVEEMETSMADDALSRGLNVIVDNTHFSPRHVARYRQLAEKHGAEFVVKEFSVDLDEAIRRDALRPNPVGSKVITQTWNRHVRRDFTPLAKLSSLKPAVMVDLDGTLAWNRSGRGFYDWSRVGDDDVNFRLLDLLNGLVRGDGDLVLLFVSGRDGSCRGRTAEWLHVKCGFSVASFDGYRLMMRQCGDVRPDEVVKREIYDAEIGGKYDVRAVFDDRLKVCRMWHSLGLPVMRVGDPDADF